MKKFTVVLFSALLALSFTACDSSNNTKAPVPSTPVSEVSPTEESEISAYFSEIPEESSTLSSEEIPEESSTPSSEEEYSIYSPEASTSGIPENSLFKRYADLSVSGVCYIDMIISTTIDDTTTDRPMIIATNGQKMYWESEIMEQKFCMLYDGTDTYMLDSTEKIAYKTDNSSISFNIDETFGDNYTLLDSGTTDYNGTSCIFEKYDADGVEQTMYFNDDGNLIAFTSSESDTENVLYIINEFTDEIPDGLLEIPSDYTITEYSTETEI